MQELLIVRQSIKFFSILGHNLARKLLGAKAPIPTTLSLMMRFPKSFSPTTSMGSKPIQPHDSRNSSTKFIYA